jgi:hypothetical protein
VLSDNRGTFVADPSAIGLLIQIFALLDQRGAVIARSLRKQKLPRRNPMRREASLDFLG